MKITDQKFIHYLTKKKMEKKYLKDFFIYNKRYHWFIIPTIVFYYRKDVFFETGITSPAVGLSVRWLTFFAGMQIQKNIYYKNGQ